MCARMYLIYTCALTQLLKIMDDFSSLFSGGFGLLGAGLNYVLNSKLQDKQNKFYLDMWKLNNEYNSPSAQMQRFKDAGLNPNLMYTHGTAGLSSAPPQQNVPQAPDFQEGMSKLGRIFNIEGLKTTIANRKKAEAEADSARTDATRNEYQLRSEESFPLHYAFDLKSGQYVEMPENIDPNAVVVRHPAATWTMDRLSRNYGRNFLVPYKSAYLGTQNKILAPQVKASQYGGQHYKLNYWLGTGRTAAQALSPFIWW